MLDNQASGLDALFAFPRDRWGFSYLGGLLEQEAQSDWSVGLTEGAILDDVEPDDVEPDDVEPDAVEPKTTTSEPAANDDTLRASKIQGDRKLGSFVERNL